MVDDATLRAANHSIADNDGLLTSLAIDLFLAIKRLDSGKAFRREIESGAANDSDRIAIGENPNSTPGRDAVDDCWGVTA